MSARNTPITEVDRLAQEEGLELTPDGAKRRFSAWDRDYLITEARPGKVGVFPITVAEPDGGRVEVVATRGRLRSLFRSAVERGGAG